MPTNKEMAEQSVLHWLENKERLDQATTDEEKREAVLDLDIRASSCAFCRQWNSDESQDCVKTCALSKIGEHCLDNGSAYSDIEVHYYVSSWSADPEAESMRIVLEDYEGLRKAVDHMIEVIRKAGQVPD